MTTYARRGYQRRSYPVTAGRVARPNKRPGECRDCGGLVPALGGQLWRESDGTWSVVHEQERQGGWLMDPRPVTGGCPESTDKRNAELHASGFFGQDAPLPASERDRIARRAATAASVTTEPRVHYGYTGSGRRRCEDAPCCGCCD